MKIGIIILIVLAIIHFIYESIILPSIRLALRYKLFAIRDKLRHLQIENKLNIDIKIFDSLQLSINNAINLLPYINFYFLKKSLEKSIENKEIDRQVEKRIALFKKCENKEIKKIHYKIGHYALLSLIANNFMFVLYLFPIVIGIIAVNNAKNLFLLGINKIDRLIHFPESEIHIIVPHST